MHELPFNKACLKTNYDSDQSKTALRFSMINLVSMKMHRSMELPKYPVLNLKTDILQFVIKGTEVPSIMFVL